MKQEKEHKAKGTIRLHFHLVYRVPGTRFCTIVKKISTRMVRLA